MHNIVWGCAEILPRYPLHSPCACLSSPVKRKKYTCSTRFLSLGISAESRSIVDMSVDCCIELLSTKASNHMSVDTTRNTRDLTQLQRRWQWVDGEIKDFVN